MHTYMHRYIHTYMCVAGMNGSMHVCMDACLPACLPARPRACLDACIHACMHACMLVRMYACTYICTYVDGRQSSQAGLQVGGQACRRMHACMYKVCPHMHIGMSADICTVSVPRSPSNAMSLRLNRPFGDRIVLCVRECVCPGLKQETGPNAKRQNPSNSEARYPSRKP